MKNPARASSVTRRQFLGLTGAALAAPTLICSRAWGAAAPSQRITLGIIGCGNMGTSNLRAFLKQKDCHVIAACDVDKKHLAHAVGLINKEYGDQGCKAHDDFRELLARKDLDAVMVAVPNHWHALVEIEAGRQKKDIYGEKPLARTIAEQQSIVKTVQENNRI